MISLSFGLKRLPKYLLTIPVFLFLVASISLVVAQTMNQVIHACVAQSNSSERAQNVNGQANDGSVRIVSSSADCKTGEYYISWNSGYGVQEQIDALLAQANDLQSQINSVQPAKFVQVTVGLYHTCGLKSNGFLDCRGDNYYGEAEVPAGHKYTTVSANTWHTLALNQDGTLEHWGPTFSFNPRLPPPDLSFTQISSGGNFACGLEENGQIYCWGDSGSGQLNVPAGNDFIQVVTGDSHVCGLTSGGNVLCWGDNSYNQEAVPQGVVFSKISAALYTTCGLDSSGLAHCWGNVVNEAPSDVMFTDISTLGFWINCGIKQDGHVQCWGDGSELIDPYAAPTDKTFVKLSTGYGDHMCGITAEGVISCWGSNRYSEAPRAWQ